jgi:hypothetical protein
VASYPRRTRKRSLADSLAGGRPWKERTETWSSPSKVFLRSDITRTGRVEYIPGISPKGQQVTVDENHKGLPSKRSDGGFAGDVGGFFDSQRSFVKGLGGAVIEGEGAHSGNWIKVRYEGPLAAVSVPNVLIPSPPTPGNLDVLGATAISRCKPTNSVADASTFLGELLREGLPTLVGIKSWKKKTSVAREAGGGYLNAEFGWKPIVADIQSLAKRAAEANLVLSQYERDAGRQVRRTYEFPIEQTRTIQYLGPSDGVHSGSVPSNVNIDTSRPVPSLYKQTKFYRKTWFSGAFVYHLPSHYDSRIGLFKAAARSGPLLGLDLRPEVVWNLAPWTWAIDWFSNAGDVVSNLSDWATDGLVMSYGYMMEHTIIEDTYWLAGPTRWKPGYPTASTVVAVYERKRRVRASPFGFGLTINMLSPRQLAIAAALGLSKW